MNKYTKSRKSYLQTIITNIMVMKGTFLSFSENVLIEWASLMSFGSSFQLLSAEILKAFLPFRS